MRDSAQLRIMQLAMAISGDSKTASDWYWHQPLEPFDEKTADCLVSEGRAEDVIRYLHSIEIGVVG